MEEEVKEVEGEVGNGGGGGGERGGGGGGEGGKGGGDGEEVVVVVEVEGNLGNDDYSVVHFGVTHSHLGASMGHTLCFGSKRVGYSFNIVLY